jgi:hypothetical protein
MEVKAFLSERVVVTLTADGHRHKIFQIVFAKDGSFYVTFPYFRWNEKAGPSAGCDTLPMRNALEVQSKGDRP